MVPPRFRLAAFDAANPSLPDTFNRAVASAAYPVLSNGGHSERVLLIPSRNVRSLLPGPFYDCLVPVYTPTPALCNLDRSYTLPVRCFILFTCACEKYTGLFVVCQAFFVGSQKKIRCKRATPASYCCCRRSSIIDIPTRAYERHKGVEVHVVCPLK